MSSIARALDRLAPAFMLVASILLFVLLYFALVHPQRAAVTAARQRLYEVRSELDRRHALAKQSSAEPQPQAVVEIRPHIADADPRKEVADAITVMLQNPPVGGVRKLSIDTSTTHTAPSRVASVFNPPVQQLLVTVAFDARYEQVTRFFANLRSLPTAFELQSVELTRAEANLTHARISLLVFHRGVRNTSPPTKLSPHPPIEPAARVDGILLSGRRRVARIDGRVVGVGDRVGSSVVQAIEPESVVLMTMRGETRRVPLQRPGRF